MKEDKKQREKQLSLGIEYRGNKTVERIHYKSRRIFLLLDQFAFWRSPLLWLLIFVNAGLGYLFLSLFFSADTPPTIPLMYYLANESDALVPAISLPFFVAAHFVLQAAGVYVAGRMYYKLKQYSRFLLMASIVVTMLFYATMFKSLTLTLPIS
jgi:hypothetical protein